MFPFSFSFLQRKKEKENIDLEPLMAAFKKFSIGLGFLKPLTHSMPPTLMHTFPCTRTHTHTHLLTLALFIAIMLALILSLSHTHAHPLALFFAEKAAKEFHRMKNAPFLCRVVFSPAFKSDAFENAKIMASLLDG